MKNETIHIGSWADMQQFGINALTGEACAYAMRLLCDVNEDGRDLVVEYFGLRAAQHEGEEVLPANWNSLVDGKPAVGSIMLHRQSLLQVAEFALQRSEPLAIVYKGGESVMGVYTPHMLDEYRKLIDNWPATTHRWTMRTIAASAHPHVGSRNVHAATGRTD